MSWGMKYILTSPDRIEHNTDRVVKLLEKHYDCFLVVMEYGKDSDNPHLNVAIRKSEKGFHTFLRDLKTAYYGKKLLVYKTDKGFSQHGVHKGPIHNEEGIKNFCNYLKKEMSKDHKPAKLISQKGIDLFQLTEGMEPYDAEKCRAQSKYRKKEKYDKSLVIEKLVEIHNTLINSPNFDKVSTHTFNVCVCHLAGMIHRKECDLDLNGLLNRITNYYILYSIQLGDTRPLREYIRHSLENFIEPQI